MLVNESVGEFYEEYRAPEQRALDITEASVGVAAVAAGAYLLTFEKQADFDRANDLQEAYIAGTCSETECGTAVTNSIMENEYYVLDSLGSMMLVSAGVFAVLHRATRPARFFAKAQRHMKKFGLTTEQ